MAHKSEQKRQQILDIATAMFLKHGYDAVSMSQINRQVGGSKSTLYSYFEGKEDLFLHVILNSIQRMVENASSSIDPTLPLFEKLRLLGVNFLTFILAEDNIALRRMVIATSNIDDTGRQDYHQIINESWEHVAEMIEEAMNDGILKKEDPWSAAKHLKCLFEYDLVDRRLLNIDKKTSKEDIEKTVDAGLDVFRCRYEKKHET